MAPPTESECRSVRRPESEPEAGEEPAAGDGDAAGRRARDRIPPLHASDATKNHLSQTRPVLVMRRTLPAPETCCRTHAGLRRFTEAARRLFGRCGPWQSMWEDRQRL